MSYISETQKAREILGHYFDGLDNIVDVGPGSDKIYPRAVGIDGRDLPGINHVLSNEYMVYDLPNLFPYLREKQDILFSSHCVEHLADEVGALVSFTGLIRPGGLFILYLPDGRYYSNEGNMEHARDYNYDNFMFFFKRVFCGELKNYRGENIKAIYELVESGVDIRPDCYSFFVVARKL